MQQIADCSKRLACSSTPSVAENRRRNKAKAREAFVTAGDVARLQGTTLWERRRAKTLLAEIAN
jgi:hypothetical protein